MDINHIDVANIPFSRYGAYVAVTAEPGKNYLTIRNARRRFEDEAFRLSFQRGGKDADVTVFASPCAITVQAAGGCARIYIRNDRSIVIDTDRLDVTLLQLSDFGYGEKYQDSCYKFISVPHRIYETVIVERGNGVISGPFVKSTGNKPIDRRQKLVLRCEDGKVCLCLEISILETNGSHLPIDVAGDLSAISQEWDAFRNSVPDFERNDEFGKITWYNLWSCFVRLLHRRRGKVGQNFRVWSSKYIDGDFLPDR